GLLLAACAKSSTTTQTTSPPAGGSTETSAAPATAADCAKGVTSYVSPGALKIGTDNPAYPPWYAGDDTAGTNWKINNPATGKGFESAVAYAVALKGTPITQATTRSDLKDFSLASQIGTTDYDYIVNVIKPNKEAGAYNSLADAVQALKSGSVDGIVVDLPTAFYITAVQIPNGVIVGQFPPAGGQQEYFAMAFAKGNPLVQCVNMALEELKSDGTLQSIQDRWLSSKVSVPVFSTS